jgi:predicted nucleic-acid-binding Zn-ribbon protein
MPLDADATRKLTEWLSSKGAPKCPQCGGNVWAARDCLAAIALGELQPDGKIVPLQQSLPAYVMSCAHCGYVVMFNAEIVGMVADDQP